MWGDLGEDRSRWVQLDYTWLWSAGGFPRQFRLVMDSGAMLGRADIEDKRQGLCSSSVF